MKDPGLSEATALGVVEQSRLKEISGMVASQRYPGVLWVHNDGSDTRLFAINTNGQVLATFEVQAKAADLEDIALGPGNSGRPEIYLGDIGDNDRKRKTFQVLRCAEPDLSTEAPAKKPRPLPVLDILTLRYPDRAQDAEALLVDAPTGDLFVATKLEKRTRIYMVSAQEISRASPSITLTFLCELPYGDISAGDISSDGSQVILRREDADWLWIRAPGETVAVALGRTPNRVPVMGPPQEPNGESLAFSANGHGYFTLSEGRRQPIYLFSPAALQAGEVR